MASRHYTQFFRDPSETGEMPTITLTDITVRSLKPVPGKRVTYLDKTIKGFGVRVTENGIKSFVLTYGEDRKRVKLGDVGIIKLADAREKAKTILAEQQINSTPSGPEIEFGEALEKFLTAYAAKNKPSTARETERLLNRHLKPEMEGQNLATATKRRVVAILDDIEATSERRHFYTAAHTFFRWARRYDLPNPLEGVEKPPKSPSRTRLLTDEEFIKVWSASLATGTYGLLVRCLLVSGQRLNQIASLDSSFIDRSNRLIVWPAHLMKTNKEFVFPYGDLLHSLLPQGDGLLFTTEEGKPWNSWTDPHITLLEKAGVPHFTRHDCRRFYSSTHSAIRTPPHIRELLLSHAIGSEVSGIYDRYTYLDEKRAAQQAYEQHLAQLIAAP